jgi:hypothetical protein
VTYYDYKILNFKNPRDPSKSQTYLSQKLHPTMVASVMNTSLLILSCISFLLIPVAVDSFAAASKKKTGGTATKGFGAPKTPWKVYTPDETVATVSLTEFLRKNKADISNTEIGFDPVTSKQGLYATKNFKEGQVICQVPSACPIQPLLVVMHRR